MRCSHLRIDVVVRPEHCQPRPLGGALHLHTHADGAPPLDTATSLYCLNWAHILHDWCKCRPFLGAAAAYPHLAANALVPLVHRLAAGQHPSLYAELMHQACGRGWRGGPCRQPTNGVGARIAHTVWP